MASGAVPGRLRTLLRPGVEIACAECGCMVERGEIVTPCDAYPECCCADLPVRQESD